MSHAPMVSHFAGKFSIPVLFIDYSLAPENPFPTAINEVLKVYQTLLLKHASSEIIFMGDSAGGGLAISVLSKNKGVDSWELEFVDNTQIGLYLLEIIERNGGRSVIKVVKE